MKFNLVVHPRDFPAAITKAATLGQMDALEGKRYQQSTQKVMERICSRWYRGHAKAIKAAYNGGFWNAENVLSGKLKGE